MGLWWIVVMHEPVNDPNGDPSLLYVYRFGDSRRLDACSGKPDCTWLRNVGFAFAVSSSSANATADKQVSSQS